MRQRQQLSTEGNQSMPTPIYSSHPDVTIDYTSRLETPTGYSYEVAIKGEPVAFYYEGEIDEALETPDDYERSQAYPIEDLQNLRGMFLSVIGFMENFPKQLRDRSRRALQLPLALGESLDYGIPAGSIFGGESYSGGEGFWAPLWNFTDSFPDLFPDDTIVREYEGTVMSSYVEGAMNAYDNLFNDEQREAFYSVVQEVMMVSLAKVDIVFDAMSRVHPKTGPKPVRVTA